MSESAETSTYRRTPGKRTLRVLALTVALSAVAASSAHAVGAGAGSLDSTFGGDGKVRTNFTTDFDSASDVAIQADQKIVTVGTAGIRFGVARHNPNGTLDTTFSGDGKQRTNFGQGAEFAGGVVVQPDGRIVVAGSVELTENSGKFGVARYNANGTLDTTFSGDGKVTTNFVSGPDRGTDVALQPDGKIVVAGVSDVGGNPRFAVVRYNADGTRDSTFSGDGKVRTDLSSGEANFDGAMSVAVQLDGKIVAAGISNGGREGPGDSRVALLRYNSDGNLDSTFSGDGVVRTNFTNDFDLANGLALQTDGKIVVSGTGGSGRFALARYTTAGSLDSTFSEDGKVMTNLTTKPLDVAHDLAIQLDGKIVAVGESGRRFGVVRYESDGSLDTTFSDDGKVRTRFTSGFDDAEGVALQADGNIVVVGTANSAFALARYLAD